MGSSDKPTVSLQGRQLSASLRMGSSCCHLPGLGSMHGTKSTPKVNNKTNPKNNPQKSYLLTCSPNYFWVPNMSHVIIFQGSTLVPCRCWFFFICSIFDTKSTPKINKKQTNPKTNPKQFVVVDMFTYFLTQRQPPKR